MRIEKSGGGNEGGGEGGRGLGQLPRTALPLQTSIASIAFAMDLLLHPLRLQWMLLHPLRLQWMQ